MTAKNSKTARESGPQTVEFTLPPSKFLLVCGPESETDPEILSLAQDGFMRIRHDPNHFAFDERSGSVLPSEAELWGYKEHGQLQPGLVQLDGNPKDPDRPVTAGRTRLKGMAILNKRASDVEGTFVEPFLFKFIIVRGTEERSFALQIIENEHRSGGSGDKPTVRAAKMLRGKEVHHWTVQYLSFMFRTSESNVQLLMKLNDLSADARKAVDAGFPAAIAARLLTQFKRDEQAGVLAKLDAIGIRKGAAAEDALRRLLDGVPLAVPSTDDDADSSDGDDSEPETVADDTAEKADPKPSKPKPDRPASFVRNPSRQVVTAWEKGLVAAAKAAVPEVPEKYKTAIDAAFARGAAMMAGRFLNKEPRGWKSCMVPLLEPKEE